MAKQIVNLSDTVKTFQEKVNIISADVGWRGNLTTNDSDIVGGINELDSDIGARPHTNLTTDAKTLTGAANELDGRLDSANNTQINSAKLHMRDSSATNTIKGRLDVHSNVDIGGNLQVDGSLTVDGVVTFKAGTSGTVALGDDSADNIDFNADVVSNIIPGTTNAFSLGSNTQRWKDAYLAGNATIAGNIIVDGTVDGRDIAADGTLLDTHDTELGTITAVAMGTTASTVSTAIAELDSDRDRLVTLVEPTRAIVTTATTITSAVNELKSRIDLLDSGASDQLAQIGDLATLDTTAKNTLVAAINELDDRIDTDADFRNKVSATDAGGDGSFAYNQGTGVFTYTGPSASEVQAHFSNGTNTTYSAGAFSISDATIRGKVSATDNGGDGSFSYNSSTGVFAYTGPSASEVRAHFSGGTEIGISSGTINHSNVTRTNTTSTGSVAYGGTFTAVDSITTNARGHVTAANTKTVTIPAAYSHPSHPGDDFSIDTGALTGATVISDLDINVTTDTLGHVTDANATVATRTLTLANLGYTGATNANNYSHPNHTGDVTSSGDGATTIATGAVTNAKLATNAVTQVKIADDAVGSAELASVVTLIIYNSAGTAIKTLYGAGS